MKKKFNLVLAMAIVAFSFIACGPKISNEAPQNESSDVKEQNLQDSLGAVKEIQTRVEEIYKDVYSYGGEWDYDDKYMSSEYKKLFAKAMETSDGPVIDYDHWTQSQDSPKPFMKILFVKKVSDTSAIVQIVVSDSILSSSSQEVKLSLIKENEMWLVDDFITRLEGEEFSEKEYLKECAQSY